jgi:hypothetical protein
MASLNFQTASEAQKPAYLSKMVDITDRIMELIGLETLKEKQDNEKRAAQIEERIAKTEALTKAVNL